MSRRRVAWLLSVPLMLGGTEAAHWLAFRLVYPNGWERAQALAQSGHAYLSYWPSFAGAGAALLVAGVVLAAREHASGTRAAVRLQPSPGLFAALPPLAFALQEHLESLVHAGTIRGVADAPTFVVGIALQLPFALLAYLLAYLLLRVVELVGRSFATRTSRPGVCSPVRLGRGDAWSLRSLALQGACPARGPPAR